MRKKAERKNGGKGEMDGVKYVFASPGYITVASPLSQVRGSNTFDTDQSLFAPSVHVRARVRPSRVLIASAVSGAKSCRTFGAKNVTTDRYSIFALFETYYIMPFYKLTSDEL